MNRKIIAFILAVTFTFSMIGSAEAATLEELQAQITQLLQMIIQLQAQLAGLTTGQPVATTITTPINITKCGQEGEKLNRNPFFGATDKVCCPGLTDIRESKSYSVCVNCGDGICKYPENSTNCPVDCHISVLPECQWCGKACMRVYSWMYCPHISPPQGYMCREINGQCRSTFTPSPTRPPITTTTIPSTTYLPDLTISSITADKITLSIGETTRILATERNIGNNSAGHHYTGIFEDNIETPISAMEINTILHGYSTIIDANYTCLRAGSHTITAIADFIHRVPTGEVIESNENNNSKTITINCITPTTNIATTDTTCTDSDGGDNIYVAGFVTGNYYPTVHSEALSHGTGTGLTKTFADYCESNNVLKEFYCVSPNVNTALSSGSEIVDVSYSCPSGYICQNGACKPVTTSYMDSINEALNKMKASLVSIVELLK